ncbi:MAG TPA: ABC transporter ATP-binding protein [Candidatus Saccharimonadales bacterium]
MQPAVDISHLSVVLGGVPVIENVTAALPAGKIIGFLGPSGAGKTTLMRTIVGRQRITWGSVQVLGLPAGAAALRSRVGYVTQAPSVYRDLSVVENLRYFAAVSGAPRSRVAEVIKEVGLSGHEKQVAAKLSGGQLSRVSLAAALLGRPELLVLDEPTVGIDPLLRRELWQRFRGLAERGTTLLVSSHVMDEAGHCDYLLLVRGGRLLAFGTLDELKHRTGAKDVEEIFLKLVGEST